MTEWPNLILNSAEVTGNEILVTLPGTSYSVIYFKPRGQSWLVAKHIVFANDRRIAMTSAEFSRKSLEGRQR
jgi:hypothetical protein